MAREPTNFQDGVLRAPIEYVPMDRDSKFTAQFQEILRSESVEPVLVPPKSPNGNAWIERFFLSLNSEALDRMIFFGEAALRRAIRPCLSASTTVRPTEPTASAVAP